MAVASSLTPERFLELDDVTLKAAGFSRQKTRDGRELAGAILSGDLNLAALDVLDDDAVTAALTQVVGIGRWTADIYLLMALCRPDAWPAGDLALAIAARHALGLAATPSTAELASIGEAWRPWRAVARACSGTSTSAAASPRSSSPFSLSPLLPCISVLPLPRPTWVNHPTPKMGILPDGIPQPCVVS